MWYNSLINNKFLISLYKQIPDLKDVRIEKIEIEEEGEKVAIIFDMPRFADNIPLKWLQSGNDTVTVELNFWNIHNLKMYANNLKWKGSIKIENNKGGLRFLLEGNVHCEFWAEVGMIQKVTSYIQE